MAFRQHPWFNKNLPAYLAKPPPDIASQTITEIDNEVLEILMSVRWLDLSASACRVFCADSSSSSSR